MANSRTPGEFKNCKLENPSLLFGPLAQYLGSDNDGCWALASHRLFRAAFSAEREHENAIEISSLSLALRRGRGHSKWRNLLQQMP